MNSEILVRNELYLNNIFDVCLPLLLWCISQQSCVPELCLSFLLSINFLRQCNKHGISYHLPKFHLYKHGILILSRGLIKMKLLRSISTISSGPSMLPQPQSCPLQMCSRKLFLSQNVPKYFVDNLYFSLIQLLFQIVQ